MLEVGLRKSLWIAFGLLAARVQAIDSLPEIPMIGGKINEMEYVLWIGRYPSFSVVVYFFLLLYYVSFKHLFPLIEKARLMSKDWSDVDPKEQDPEERGVILKESLWVIMSNGVLSVFHLVAITMCNTFQENPLGVSTLIGTEMMNNMMQLGVILLFAKLPIYVNSWVTIRDGFIVAISVILLIVTILAESNDLIAIGFVIFLLMYWVAEAMSKIITKKVGFDYGSLVRY